MARKVNIGGKIPNSGITGAQFNQILDRIDSALGNNGRGGNASGGVTNITINQTVNEKATVITATSFVTTAGVESMNRGLAITKKEMPTTKV